MPRRVIGKSMSYFALIREALESLPDGRGTTRMIYDRIRTAHPDIFTEELSYRWKTGVRQCLYKTSLFYQTRPRHARKPHSHLWHFRAI